MSKPRATAKQSPVPRVKRGWLTAGLLVLQGLLSVGAHWLLFLQLMGVAGCDGQCDYNLLQNSIAGHQLAILGTFALTLGWLAIQLKRRRGIWWVPLSGIALMLVATVVCYALIYQGLN